MYLFLSLLYTHRSSGTVNPDCGPHQSPVLVSRSPLPRPLLPMNLPMNMDDVYDDTNDYPDPSPSTPNKWNHGKYRKTLCILRYLFIEPSYIQRLHFKPPPPFFPPPSILWHTVVLSASSTYSTSARAAAMLSALLPKMRIVRGPEALPFSAPFSPFSALFSPSSSRILMFT